MLGRHKDNELPDGLVFALLGELLFLSGQEKVTKTTGIRVLLRKTSPSGVAPGPSRRDVPVPSPRSASCLAPLRSAYARPPDGEWGPSVPVGFRSRSFFAFSGARGHATSRACIKPSIPASAGTASPAPPLAPAPARTPRCTIPDTADRRPASAPVPRLSHAIGPVLEAFGRHRPEQLLRAREEDEHRHMQHEQRQRGRSQAL